MGPFYLQEQGSKVSRQGRRLIVTKDDAELASIPIHRISRLVLMGQIQLTTSALALLLDRNIPLILTTRKGRIRGRLTGPLGSHLEIRRRQYLRAQDTPFCTDFARRLVEAKAANMVSVIRRYSYNHPGLELKSPVAEILDHARRLEACDNADSLRGMEGVIARQYFAAMVGIFEHLGMNFHGRVRRPPEDPVNACLSYTYVLLTGLVENALQCTHLDVFCGFFHAPNRNAPALALDIVEQFRQPLADRFVMVLLNKRLLSREDFADSDSALRPVLLTDKGKKRLISEWESFLNTPQRLLQNTDPVTPQQLILRQTDQLEQSIKDDASYVHFQLSL